MAVPLIPTFLFLGFLGSGKTSLINSLMDTDALEKTRTLLILVEDGEEDVSLSEAYASLTEIRRVSESGSMCKSQLLAWQRETAPRQIVIEYNGMWQLDKLSTAVPGNWFFQQIFLTANAEDYLLYNQNFRTLSAEKLRACSMAIFNRVAEMEETDALRRLVRAVNRKAEIFYENDTGMVQDQASDQLPYDIACASYSVNDESFAVWQLDLQIFPQKYKGKIVTFTGFLIQSEDVRLQIGRRVMTCCEADMEWVLFSAAFPSQLPLNGGWGRVTAQICLAGNEDISLKIYTFIPCAPPNPEIAVF